MRCRLGIHRWQKLRTPEGRWYKRCRACGTEVDVDEGGSGVLLALVLGIVMVAAGLAVALKAHSLLGPLLIIAGVAALGWVAFIVGVDRVAAFLSTGTWRRRG